MADLTALCSAALQTVVRSSSIALGAAIVTFSPASITILFAICGIVCISANSFLQDYLFPLLL